MAAAKSFIVASTVLLKVTSGLDVRLDPEEHADFHNFMSKHGREYTHGSREYDERLALFTRRVAEAEAHNSQPGRLWTADVNKLSDRTEEELAQLRGWYGAAKGGNSAESSGLIQRFGGGTFLNQRGRGRALPDEFMNWTALTTAKHIPDQGGCGSCWAVASSTVLQMHREIYNPESNRTFSTQELVDCVPNPRKCGGSGGCEGATVELAFNWAMNRGLETEKEDPYRAVTGSCSKAGKGGFLELLGKGHENLEDLTKVGVHKASKGAPGLKFGMFAWERLPENGYEALLRTIYERGPVGVSVAAKDWAMYGGGIFNSCPQDAVIDHAVTLVGYGMDRKLGQGFYSVQNSWGPEWGESGKIRLLRKDSDGELCGTDHQPELGTGCAGGPKQVKVCGMCGILYDSSVPHFMRLGP